MLIGFFDETKVKSGRLTVLRPLDFDLANQLANRFSPSRDNGVLSIRGDRFSFEQGYIRCWDFIRSREAAEFVTQLASATGCMILLADTGQTSTAEEFMARFEEMSRFRDQLRQRTRSRGPD
jgi:hypothetical protein